MLDLGAITSIHINPPLTIKEFSSSPPDITIRILLRQNRRAVPTIFLLAQRRASLNAVDIELLLLICAWEGDGHVDVLDVLVCADDVGVEELVKEDVFACHEVVEVGCVAALDAVEEVRAVEEGWAEC